MKYDIVNENGLFNIIGPDFPFLSFNITKSKWLLNDFKEASDKAYGKVEYKRNHDLAGNIKHEYSIGKYLKHDTRVWLEETASNYFLNHPWLQNTYSSRYMGNMMTKDSSSPYPPKFTSGDHIWANFQKKYEFNPIHNHAGVISWVLWLDIPYDIKEEEASGPGADGNQNLPGYFCLINTNQNNIISTEIPVDKRYNGRIIFFPSFQDHLVYPFYTSDDYRVSISGNLFLDVE